MKQRKTSNRRLIAATVAGFAVFSGWLLGTEKDKGRLQAKRNSGSAQFSFKTWRKALKETKNSFSNKAMPVMAAGVAFFSTLAFFPLMAAAVAIAAFIISSNQIQEVGTGLEQYLPADIASLISAQLQTLVGSSSSSNVTIAVFSILLSLISASGAVKHLISATNVSYGVGEDRGFVRLRTLSLGMTLAAVLVGFVILAVLLVNSSFLVSLGAPEVVASVLAFGRWPFLLAVVIVALAVFYRYGPNRYKPDWQWVTWGAVIATVLWLAVTALFFVYAQYFANFSETYSLFAGIIVLMIWLNASAFMVLLGAEINHRLEVGS